MIMGTQAFIDPAERGHLIGDVAALFIDVVLLEWLTPRKGWSKNHRRLNMKQLVIQKAHMILP